jgi:hypothetical protein
LIEIKGKRFGQAMIGNQSMEDPMPIDTIVLLAAIIIAFGVLGATLAWASHRTG